MEQGNIYKNCPSTGCLRKLTIKVPDKIKKKVPDIIKKLTINDIIVAKMNAINYKMSNITFFQSIQNG